MFVVVEGDVRMLMTIITLSAEEGDMTDRLHVNGSEYLQIIGDLEQSNNFPCPCHSPSRHIKDEFAVGIERTMRDIYRRGC